MHQPDREALLWWLTTTATREVWDLSRKERRADPDQRPLLGCRSSSITGAPRRRGDGSAAEDGGAHRLDGERCEEDPLARAQDGRVDDKAVLVDQAGLDQRSGEPCPTVGEQVPSERSCFSRVMASARSPATIVVSPHSPDASESENTTLGISFIGVANGPEAPGQWAAITA